LLLLPTTMMKLFQKRRKIHESEPESLDESESQDESESKNEYESEEDIEDRSE